MLLLLNGKSKLQSVYSWKIQNVMPQSSFESTISNENNGKQFVENCLSKLIRYLYHVNAPY